MQKLGRFLRHHGVRTRFCYSGQSEESKGIFDCRIAGDEDPNGVETQRGTGDVRSTQYDVKNSTFSMIATS